MSEDKSILLSPTRGDRGEKGEEAATPVETLVNTTRQSFPCLGQRLRRFIRITRREPARQRPRLSTPLPSGESLPSGTGRPGAFSPDIRRNGRYSRVPWLEGRYYWRLWWLDAWISQPRLCNAIFVLQRKGRSGQCPVLGCVLLATARTARCLVLYARMPMQSNSNGQSM